MSYVSSLYGDSAWARPASIGSSELNAIIPNLIVPPAVGSSPIIPIAGSGVGGLPCPTIACTCSAVIWPSVAFITAAWTSSLVIMPACDSLTAMEIADWTSWPVAASAVAAFTALSTIDWICSGDAPSGAADDTADSTMA